MICKDIFGKKIPNTKYVKFNLNDVDYIWIIQIFYYTNLSNKFEDWKSSNIISSALQKFEDDNLLQKMFQIVNNNFELII